MKTMLQTSRKGFAMSTKVIWFLFGLVGSVILIRELVLESWYLRGWVFIASLTVVLFLGLAFFFGQRETTKQVENWGKSLEKELQKYRGENENLKDRIKELEHKNN